MLSCSRQSASKMRFPSTTARAALEKPKDGGSAPEQALRGEQEELCNKPCPFSAEELHMCMRSTPTRPGMDETCSYLHENATMEACLSVQEELPPFRGWKAPWWSGVDMTVKVDIVDKA